MVARACGSSEKGGLGFSGMHRDGMSYPVAERSCMVIFILIPILSVESWSTKGTTVKMW